MLTYTIRFQRLNVKPNFTLHYYTIDEYKHVQYLNGKISINSKKLINKVSKNKPLYRLNYIIKFIL